MLKMLPADSLAVLVAEKVARIVTDSDLGNTEEFPLCSQPLADFYVIPGLKIVFGLRNGNPSQKSDADDEKDS
jgi:hypothetical protein